MFTDHFPTSAGDASAISPIHPTPTEIGKIRWELFSDCRRFAPYLSFNAKGRTFTMEWFSHDLGPFHFERDDEGVKIWLRRLSVSVCRAPEAAIGS